MKVGSPPEMETEMAGTLDAQRLCTGVVELEPKLEDWQLRLARSPERVDGLLETYGSPLHLHRVEPFERNIRQLQEVAESAGVDFDLFFARKANKALAYVAATADTDAGVDLASDQELRQLEDGVDPGRLVVTAAVKPRPLLERCVERGILVVLDNRDEAAKLAAAAREAGRTTPIAVRVSGFRSGAERLRSRFGFPVEDVLPLLAAWRRDPAFSHLRLRGLHFHLDGYDPAHRVVALDRCLDLADELKTQGTEIRFIDIGGGFPMRYLARPSQWETYWAELERALRGERRPITYRDHGFGLMIHEGTLVGKREAYPHHQPPAPGWLRRILTAPRPSAPSTTLAEALRQRRLRLACEPGRSVLDGCGATVARVEHCKIRDGEVLVGLHMNGSNCRSKKSELFTDPLLVTTRRTSDKEALEGYLTGAYCTESDLILHRKLRFPSGVEPGDAILFPNTAGYLMHFVESRSHQFPLPLNVVLEGPELNPRLDAIDARARR